MCLKGLRNGGAPSAKRLRRLRILNLKAKYNRLQWLFQENPAVVFRPLDFLDQRLTKLERYEHLGRQTHAKVVEKLEHFLRRLRAIEEAF